jgi:Transcriptional Coactivator p15 (PC4)
MSAKPPPLAEPIEVAKFWKTRRRDIAIVITLSEYESINIVNVREYFTDQAGCMKPSTRGLAMSVRRLPEFSNATRTARSTRRRAALSSIMPVRQGHAPSLHDCALSRHQHKRAKGEEKETAVIFTGGLWTVLGEASDVRRSDERSVIPAASRYACHLRTHLLRARPFRGSGLFVLHSNTLASSAVNRALANSRE